MKLRLPSLLKAALLSCLALCATLASATDYTPGTANLELTDGAVLGSGTQSGTILWKNGTITFLGEQAGENATLTITGSILNNANVAGAGDTVLNFGGAKGQTIRLGTVDSSVVGLNRTWNILDGATLIFTSNATWLDHSNDTVNVRAGGTLDLAVIPLDRFSLGIFNLEANGVLKYGLGEGKNYNLNADNKWIFPKIKNSSIGILHLTSGRLSADNVRDITGLQYRISDGAQMYITGTGTWDTAVFYLSGTGQWHATDAAKMGRLRIEGNAIAGRVVLDGDASVVVYNPQQSGSIKALDGKGHSLTVDRGDDNTTKLTIETVVGALNTLTTNMGTVDVNAVNASIQTVKVNGGTFNLSGVAAKVGQLRLTGGTAVVKSIMTGGSIDRFTAEAGATIQLQASFVGVEAMTVTKDGDGAMVMSAVTATRTGATEIKKGTLSVANMAFLGTGKLALFSDGIFSYTGTASSTVTNILSISSGGALNINDAAATVNWDLTEGARTGEIVKSGAGTLNITSGNLATSTATIVLRGGRLELTGTGSLGTAWTEINMAGGSILDSRVGGTTTIASGQVLSVTTGAGGAANAATFTGNIILNGGIISSGVLNTQLSVAGNLRIGDNGGRIELAPVVNNGVVGINTLMLTGTAGLGQLVFSPTGSLKFFLDTSEARLVNGTYTLISAAGGIVGWNESLLSLSGSAAVRKTAVFAQNGNNLDVTISGEAPTLTWTGQGSLWQTWKEKDSMASPLWTGKDAEGKPITNTAFQNFDNASFLELAGFGSQITVSGTVHVSTMLINNTTTPYRFQGGGTISTDTLEKRGSGTALVQTSGLSILKDVNLLGGKLELQLSLSDPLDTALHVGSGTELILKKTGSNNELRGVISGSGQITLSFMSTAKVYTISSNNSFSGTWMVEKDVELQLASAASVGSYTSFKKDAITLNGGILSYRSEGNTAVLSPNVGITLVGIPQIAVDNGSVLSINGAISGTGIFTKTGGGTLILRGANKYTGGTVISGGVLLLDETGTLGTGILSFTNAGRLAAATGVYKKINNTLSIEGANLTLGDNTHNGVLDFVNAVVLMADTTLTVDSNVIWSKGISGVGNLNVGGNGSFTLAGNMVGYDRDFTTSAITTHILAPQAGFDTLEHLLGDLFIGSDSASSVVRTVEATLISPDTITLAKGSMFEVLGGRANAAFRFGGAEFNQYGKLLSLNLAMGVGQGVWNIYGEADVLGLMGGNTVRVHAGGVLNIGNSGILFGGIALRGGRLGTLGTLNGAASWIGTGTIDIEADSIIDTRVWDARAGAYANYSNSTMTLSGAISGDFKLSIVGNSRLLIDNPLNFDDWQGTLELLDTVEVEATSRNALTSGTIAMKRGTTLSIQTRNPNQSILAKTGLVLGGGDVLSFISSGSQTGSATISHRLIANDFSTIVFDGVGLNNRFAAFHVSGEGEIRIGSGTRFEFDNLTNAGEYYLLSSSMEFYLSSPAAAMITGISSAYTTEFDKVFVNGRYIWTLKLDYVAESLVWRSASASADWSGIAWSAAGLPSTVAWSSGKNVQFDDSMKGSKVVLVNERVTAGSINVGSKYDLTISGSSFLTGSLLTKNGVGTLTLDVVTDLENGIRLENGTLMLAKDNVLNGKKINWFGGTLGVTTDFTLDSTLDGNLTISLGNQRALLNVGEGATLTASAGTFGFARGIVKRGAGQLLLTLAALENVSRDVNIEAGELAFSINGTDVPEQTATYTTTELASLTGAGTLVKKGTGTLILTSGLFGLETIENTYAGGTRVDVGTLQLGSGALTHVSIGTGALTMAQGTTLRTNTRREFFANNLVFLGDNTYEVNDTVNRIWTGSVSITGAVNLTGTAGAGRNLTWSGLLSGDSSSSLNMRGNVDLSLTNANNTFAGTVNVIGRLNLFSGALSNAASINLSDSAMLSWTGGNFADHLKHVVITGTNTINLGGRSVTIDQLTTHGVSDALTVAGRGSLLVHGGTGGDNELELRASTWTMDRAVLSGNISQTGLLTLGAAATTSLMEVSGNYDVLGVALIGTGGGSSSFLRVNSTGQFAYSGTNTLTVGSGENSFGQILIDAEGLFNYNSTGAFNLSSVAGAVGELVVKGIFSTSLQVTSGGGIARVFFDGGLLRSSQGASVNPFGANISVFIQAGGLNVEVVDNATTTISSALQSGQNQNSYAQWLNGVRVNGTTYFNADGGLTKEGAGTLNLTGNNTFKGGVKLKEGVLQIGSAAALGAAGSRNLTVLGKGTLDFADDTIPVINSLMLQAGGVLTLGTGNKALTLSVDGMTTFAAGSTLVMDIIGGGVDSPSDSLKMNSLTLQGDLVLELVQTNMTGQSLFTLMTLTGSFVGLDSQIKIDISKEIRGFQIETRKTLSADKELQIEVVNVGSAGKDVTWNGANGDTWTTGTTGEWKIGSKKTDFYNQDSIIFNGVSTKAQIVNTKGDLVTGDIAISGTPQYTFDGTGVVEALAGTTLTKSGSNAAIWNVATKLQNVTVTGGSLTLTKGSIEGAITVGGTDAATLSIGQDMAINDVAGTIVTSGADATINLNGRSLADADFFTLGAAKNTLMNMGLATALYGSHADAQSLVLDSVSSAGSVYGGSIEEITGTVSLTITNKSIFQANVYGGSNSVNLTGSIKDFSFNGVTITGQQLATEVNVSGFAVNAASVWLFAGNANDAVSELEGSTLMNITGGTFHSVAGGSEGGIMTGNSYISVGVSNSSARATLPNIKITGNLIGGSVGGAFTGSTNILIGDNVTIDGAVIGSSVDADGTTLASITGSSNIMISGGAQIKGSISAGITTEGSTITLKNVAEGSNMAQYQGIISGGTGGTTRTLVLDNYDAALLASLSDFTNISVTNNSDLTLSVAQTGLAGSTWTLSGNSRVSLKDVNGFGGNTSRLVMQGATLNLEGLAVGNSIDVTGGTNTLNGATNYTGAITSSSSLTLGSTLGATATITLTGGSLAMGTNAIKNDITIASGDVSLSGINYQGTLIKNGTGTLTLQTSLAQTAKIQLNAGTLNLNGKNVSNQIDVAANSNVTLSNHTQFSGSLYVGAGATVNVNNLTMKTGQVLDFLGAGTINGGLTLSGGTLNTHVVGGTLGGITVDSLTITELSLVSITDGTTLADDTYTLLTGTLTGEDFLKLTGFKGTRTSASLNYNAGNSKLTLTITQGALLTWKGAGSTTWDMAATDSWTNGGDVAYVNLDHVLFAGVNNQTIDITTIVMPGSMEVDSTAAYTFTGQGVQSAGRLIKRNTGSLTFSNGVNQFDAGMNILAGNVLVTGNSSLSSEFDGDTIDVTNSLLSAGTNLSFESTGTSVIDNLNGSGTLKLGSGQLSLGRTDSFKGGLFTGAVEVAGGTLVLKNAGAIASTKVTISAGQIDNVNHLADNSLAVVATGNVVLTGDLAGKISSFNTTNENARITVGQSLTLATASFELGMPSLVQTMQNGVVSTNQYTSIVSIGSGNTLTLDKLELSYSNLNLVNDTTYTFSITDGVLAGSILEKDRWGNCGNVTFTGENLNFYVTSIEGGNVNITYSDTKFHLRVNADGTMSPEWAPGSHLSVSDMSPFTAVTVHGVLNLYDSLGAGAAYTLNDLNGAKTGVINTDAGTLTIASTQSGSDKAHMYLGTLNATGANLTVTGNQGFGGTVNVRSLSVAADSKVTMDKSVISTSGNVDLAANAELSGEGLLNIGQGGTFRVTATNKVSGNIILNLAGASSTGGVASLMLDKDVALSLGGLTGAGTVTGVTGAKMNLDVLEGNILTFTGSLTGGILKGEGALVGVIEKTGKGEQILAAKTNADARYDLTVKEGIVRIDQSVYQDMDFYGAIQVGSQTANPGATVPVGSELAITSRVQAQGGVIVRSDGLLTIGSAISSGSLSTVSAGNTAADHGVSFEEGSRLKVYVSNSSQGAYISTSGVGNFITGLDKLSEIELVAGNSWQTFFDFTLFASTETITGSIDLDKLRLDGLGNVVIDSSGNKIVISAERANTSDKPYIPDAGGNAYAGGGLLGSAILAAKAQGRNIDDTLGSVCSAMDALGNNSAEGLNLLAAVSGSTITSLLGSQRDDFRQQMGWIRNRTVGMGISPDFAHEGLPYINGWIQANGGTNRLSDDGQEAGYTMNTFGGSFGFDVDMSPRLTWGFAFTANYNKLTATGADTAKGHNDAYYANVFLRMQNKKWANTFILTGGFNQAKLDRTVSAPGVAYSTHGTTDGNSVGFMYEATYDYALNEDKTRIFQPLINLSFASSSMKGYQEEGAGDAGLHVDDMDASYGAISVGARLMGLVGQNTFARAAMGELRLQVVQDIGDDTNEISVGMIGSERFKVTGTKVGKTALQIGAGLSIPVTEKGSLYFDLNTDFRSKATSVNGSVGYRINF